MFSAEIYKQSVSLKGRWCELLASSGESRIIFLPERSSICQYRPEISAIIVKTQSRARLVLAHPVLYIVKTQKMYCTNILKTTISKSTKKRYTLRSATWTIPGSGLGNPT